MKESVTCVLLIRSFPTSFKLIQNGTALISPALEGSKNGISCATHVNRLKSSIPTLKFSEISVSNIYFVIFPVIFGENGTFLKIYAKNRFHCPRVVF